MIKPRFIQKFPLPALEYPRALLGDRSSARLNPVRPCRRPAHTGAPVFQAFAVTSFNDHTNQYELRTYTNGYASNATAEFLPDGAFRWSVGAGPGTRMRFTIWFDATTWRETGEISTDGGATWRETIELNLRKVS